MTGHPSQDELADHLAAASPPAVDAGVAAHLQTCAQCRERLDRLAGDSADVTRVLAAEPAPSMPDDVFARITGALRDERVARDREAASSTAPVELARARQQRRQLGLRRPARVLVAAAAVVVAAGVGVSIFTHGGLGPSDSGNNAATTVAGSSQSGGAGSGGASAGSSSLTALHRASFARDVRALLAASPARKSGSAGANNGNNGPNKLNRQRGGSFAAGRVACSTKVLAGTRFAHETLSVARSVTVDGTRAQLVIATDGHGRRTAIALGGCAGRHPHVLVKAGL